MLWFVRANPNPTRKRGAPRYLDYASGCDWQYETS